VYVGDPADLPPRMPGKVVPAAELVSAAAALALEREAVAA